MREILSTGTKEHCSLYKGCIKCPFVGNECVAPVEGYRFNDWLEKMNTLISKQVKK